MTEALIEDSRVQKIREGMEAGGFGTRIMGPNDFTVLDGTNDVVARVAVLPADPEYLNLRRPHGAC